MRRAPAQIGDPVDAVWTPALIVDLDAFDANIRSLASFASAHGVGLRPHAKTHKSADISKIQMAHGAIGVCCQKLSEAEALVAGGVSDVLISNEVVGERRLDELAGLAGKARMLVCVDDPATLAAMSRACVRHGTTLEVLVEIDVGQGRCGVAPGHEALVLAQSIDALGGLRFAGLQAYNGSAQHYRPFAEREKAVADVVLRTRETVDLLRTNGLQCKIIGGGGTGSFEFEGASGLFTELQCGSYIFMDADYGRNLDRTGAAYAPFQNSLFVLSTVMSKTRAGQAVCDAGHKAYSLDSGMPVVAGDDPLEVIGCSDEHGVLGDPANRLRLEDRIRLIPGHCDPTVNLHDWMVGIRDGRVEVLWPVTARGCLY